MFKSNFVIKFLITGICLTSQIVACNEKEKPKSVNNQTVNKKPDVLELEKTIILSGIKGRIDHMAIDLKNQVLFIPALGNNSVESVGLLKGDMLNSITAIDEPQGIVFIPDNNTICAASGGSGDCIFYDAKTFSVMNSLKLGSDADNLRYEPSLNLIFAGYGEGGIAVIDALKQTLISKITFTGHPEAFQFEKSSSRIFVNVPSSKSIRILNYKSNTVMNSINTGDAAANFPMSLDEDNHLLFTGYRKSSQIIVYDTELLKETARFEIRDDVDDIFYDRDKKLLYVSCGEGYLQVFKQENKDTYNQVQSVKTSKGARTCLFVPELDKIFVACPKSEENEAAIQIYNIKK